MRRASSTWSRSERDPGVGEPLDRPVGDGAVGGHGDDRGGDVGIERPFAASTRRVCGASRGVLRLLAQVVALVDPHLERAGLDAFALAVRIARLARRSRRAHLGGASFGGGELARRRAVAAPAGLAGRTGTAPATAGSGAVAARSAVAPRRPAGAVRRSAGALGWSAGRFGGPPVRLAAHRRAIRPGWVWSADGAGNEGHGRRTCRPMLRG